MNLNVLRRHAFTRFTHSQATGNVFSDPRRPELFYHLIQPPTPISPTSNVFALSFLSRPLPNAQSSAILGWVPAPNHPDTLSPQDIMQRLQWRDFRENAAFKDVLHKSIYASLRDAKDEIWENAAKYLQDGWMHIHDQRNPPPLGRIGDPDDIIASVLVENSIVKPETYQAMPSYRVRTADGVMQLTPELLEELVQALHRVAEGEDASINP